MTTPEINPQETLVENDATMLVLKGLARNETAIRSVTGLSAEVDIPYEHGKQIVSDLVSLGIVEVCHVEPSETDFYRLRTRKLSMREKYQSFLDKVATW